MWKEYAVDKFFLSILNVPFLIFTWEFALEVLSVSIIIQPNTSVCEGFVNGIMSLSMGL